MHNLKTYILNSSDCRQPRQALLMLCMLLMAVAIVSSCSSGSDDVASPTQPTPPAPVETVELPVTFNAMTSDAEDANTRATQYGAGAAGILKNSFRAYGIKLNANANGSTQTVFNGTKVVYTANTAGSSSTNTNDWEYVGVDGYTEHIRYWDQAADGYIFFASAPDGVSSTMNVNETAKTVTMSVPSLVATSYTQISDLSDKFMTSSVVVNPKAGTPSFSGTVNLKFMNALSRIRIGFLSGEDDYSGFDAPQHLSIYDVQFSPAANYKSEKPYDLVTTPSVSIPVGGSIETAYKWTKTKSEPLSEYTVEETTTSKADGGRTVNCFTFNNYGAYNGQISMHTVGHTPSDGFPSHYSIDGSNYVEEALYVYPTECYKPADGSNPAEPRASSTFVRSDYKDTPEALNDDDIHAQWLYVFPTTTPATALATPVNNYTPQDWRLAIKININNIEFIKTAIVPAEYMQWLPNHQYTYIFKVSPVSLSIVGVDVKVMDWKEGSHTEDEQHQW